LDSLATSRLATPRTLRLWLAGYWAPWFTAGSLWPGMSQWSRCRHCHWAEASWESARLNWLCQAVRILNKVVIAKLPSVDACGTPISMMPDT